MRSKLTLQYPGQQARGPRKGAYRTSGSQPYRPKQRVHLLLLCAGLSATLLLACDRPVESPPPTVTVLADPWGARSGDGSPGAQLYASCASCHMADGSGRADGTIPSLAGQRATVLIDKLERLHAGAVTLPVMTPFARALTTAEIVTVATYLSTLATMAPPAPHPVADPRVEQVAGQATGTTVRDEYQTYCAGCHGVDGEGSDALLAPRLCGQHEAYLLRRMDESLQNQRGDADPAMAAIVQGLAPATRQDIAAWLAGGSCFPGDAP